MSYRISKSVTRGEKFERAIKYLSLNQWIKTKAFVSEFSDNAYYVWNMGCFALYNSKVRVLCFH